MDRHARWWTGLVFVLAGALCTWTCGALILPSLLPKWTEIDHWLLAVIPGVTVFWLARRSPRWTEAILGILAVGLLFGWIWDLLLLQISPRMSADSRESNAIVVGTSAAAIAAAILVAVIIGKTKRNANAQIFLTDYMPIVESSFLPRPEQDELREKLEKNKPAVDTVIIVGSGGTGKTQLAAQYATAQKERQKIDLLIWADAIDRSSIIKAYASAASRAGLITLEEGGDLTEAAAHFLSWLDGEKGKKWLVVLDDVANPKDLKGLIPRPSKRGRTIITTSRDDRSYYEDTWEELSVESFDRERATEYIRRRLRRNQDLLTEAGELAQDLGGLPLALDIASEYILKEKITCAQYRAHLNKRRTSANTQERDGLQGPDVIREKNEIKHKRTIVEIWSTSIERVEQYQEFSPLPRRLMELLSLLDPNGVPFSIFDYPAAHDYLGSHSPGEIRAALSALWDFRLLTDPGDDEDRPIRLHNLIQQAVRATSDHDRINDATRILADSMAAQWPGLPLDKYFARLPQGESVRPSSIDGNSRATGQFSLLLQNNAVNLSRANPGPLRNPRLNELLFRLGDSYGQAGSVHRAYEYFKGILEEVTRAPGTDAADILRLRVDEAIWLGYSGKSADALSKFEELEREMPLDKPGDVRTLFVRHNIARFLGRAKDAAAAVDFLQRLVEDETRFLPADHELTLDSRGILGYWLNEDGKSQEAATELEPVIQTLIARGFGSKHQLTLRARNDLADAEASMEKYGAAIELGNQVLLDRLETLGPRDPATLTSRANLARWKGKRGDHKSATAELKSVVNDAKRYLRDNHPGTLRYQTYYIEAQYEGAKRSRRSRQALLQMTDHHKFICQELGEKHIRARECRDILSKWNGKSG